MTLLVILLAAVLSLSAADIQTARPRVISATKLMQLNAWKNAETANYLALKAYVDANMGTSSGSLSLAVQHGAALMYTLTGDSTYATRAAVLANQAADYLSLRYEITAVTNANPAQITLSVPHGVAVGSTFRCYPSFFTGSWTTIRGERTCTSTGTNTVTVAVNSTSFGTFSPNGERLFRAMAGDFGTNYTRWQWWKLPLVYDLVHSTLSSDDKTKFAEYMRGIIEYKEVQGSYYITGTNPANVHMMLGNLGSGNTMFVTYALAALHGDWDQAQTKWGTNRTIIGHIMDAMNAGKAQGGALLEGSEYAPQALEYQFRFLEAVKAASGEDLWAIIPNWATEVAEFSIHSSSPTAGGTSGLLQPMPDGDAQADVVETYAWTTRAYSVQVIDQLQQAGNNTLAAKMKDWVNIYRPTWVASQPNEYWFLEFQHMDESLAASDYKSGTELDYLATGNGRLRSRNNWTSSATWTGFDCGYQVIDHAHAQCGNFNIWRNGKWLTRKAIGYGTTWWQSVGGNVMWMNGRGTATQGTPEGQGSISRYYSAADNSYIYARAASGPLYHYRTFTQITAANSFRDFIWLKELDTWIGFDYCTFETGNEKHCSFLIQSVPGYTTDVAGQRITITEPSSGQKLYVDTVTPSTATITTRQLNKNYITALNHADGANLMSSFIAPSPSSATIVGATAPWDIINGSISWSAPGSDGLGKLASGLNTSGISTSTPFIGQSATFGNTITGVAAGGFFTEVTAGTLANSHNHLFVMQATDSGASAPSVAPKLVSTNIESTQVGSYVIGFVPTDTPVLPITYTYTSGPSVSHRLFGFAPSQEYNCESAIPGMVTISTGTGCTANSQGVIELGTLSGDPAITLNVSPATLSFSAIEGGAQPANQSFSVTAVGGVAAYTLTEGCSWLSLSGISGITPQNISAAVDTSGLATGDHFCTIYVGSGTAGVINSPQVHLTLTIVAATESSLISDASSKTFTWTAGTGVPASQQFSVAATGENVAVEAVLSDPPGIFAVTPSSGTTPLTFAVTPTVANLFPGVYTAGVSIRGSGLNVPPIEVPLTLSVTASGTVDVRVRPSGTQAVLTYGTAGLPASQPCIIRIVGPTFTELGRITDLGGMARRTYVWSTPALTPLTSSKGVEVMCGTLAGTATFDTPRTGTGTAIMTVTSRAAGTGASKMKVSWGYTPALSEPALTVTCTNGHCRAPFTVLRDRIIYHRREFLNSADAVVAGPSAIGIRDVQ